MTHTISRLTGIAYRNGWNIRPLNYANGDPGGFIASRAGTAITVSTNRRGRILDIKHTDFPYTRVLADKAGHVTDWLTTT